MNDLRRLGMSIYPAHQQINEMKEYITKGHKCGYSRLFASMLELTEETKDQILNKFKETFKFAKELNFDICLDVNPRIFGLLGVTPSNLKIFNDIHATTIRLDMPMDGRSEAEMTYNPFGINVEVNISNGTEYISNIMSYKPLKDKLIACHNFYPQNNAGLDYEFFLESTKMAKKYGIRTAAFVSSSVGKQGPWNVSDGLPTLEIHRNLPISTQAKHLWATGLIDDVLIGNAFASDAELTSLAKIDRYKITVGIDFVKDASDLEKKIVLLNNHFRRGDINNYSIRSTMSRVVYKAEPFEIHDNNFVQTKGDIFIGNNDFGIYKGELQLIINEMKNDPRKNLVARVNKEDIFLLDFIKSWNRFKFIEEDKNGDK